MKKAHGSGGGMSKIKAPWGQVSGFRCCLPWQNCTLPLFLKGSFFSMLGIHRKALPIITWHEGHRIWEWQEVVLWAVCFRGLTSFCVSVFKLFFWGKVSNLSFPIFYYVIGCFYLTLLLFLFPVAVRVCGFLVSSLFWLRFTQVYVSLNLLNSEHAITSQ